ncbi:MAG: hypothetical protein LUF35_14930 [Lachnospiraceae bacterium]|nr:hypothetical protein [Lachnospiraceae bacterium]
MNNTEASEEKQFSSDIRINMGREFVYQNFPGIRKENDPVYGAADSGEVVIEPINFDALNYLFMREGTYVVLFGGVWSAGTQELIGQVNYYAGKYGVDTVYLFDFSADGTAEGTIKQDITAHEYYIGSDKKETSPFAVYNYLYGEVVTRYLTNLDSWVKKKIGGGDDITYLNLYRDPVTVPNLTEPFLFIYNKDNTIDHSGDSAQADTYPIVWAAELDGCSGQTETESVESIFRHVRENNGSVTPWTPADYVREAYAKNGRGHGFKTEDAFTADEPINLQAVPFQVYRWILKQKGTFLLMLVGPWCANSQAAVATVNDYAVANHVRVYMTDSRLDSKHAIDFWKYPRKNELTMSCPPMRKYYVDIWENDLTGAPIMNASIRRGRILQPTVDYTDETGRQHSVLSVGIPYCYAYNKDHTGGRDGARRPVLSSFHNETMELINTSERFVYYAPPIGPSEPVSTRYFTPTRQTLARRCRRLPSIVQRPSSPAPPRSILKRSLITGNTTGIRNRKIRRLSTSQGTRPERRPFLLTSALICPENTSTGIIRCCANPRIPSMAWKVRRKWYSSPWILIPCAMFS